MKITLLLFLLVQIVLSYETNYAKLAKSKADFKKSQQIKKSLTLDKKSSIYKNYIEIIHKELSENTTDSFSKNYELTLYKCIAKNICIYKYDGDRSLNILIREIKNTQKDIKAVYKYERRNLTAF